MKSWNGSRTRFIATTPGLSATRWLAFVLGSHPDVFVAHGQFQLDSVLRADFAEEKRKGDIKSLTIGNEMASFYASHTLSEVFAAYRELKPDAHAYGNIHSYTLGSLLRLVKNADELAGINVANVLRHPIAYIDSHFSLVRSAERHPDLYQHYAQNLFGDALRQFPELFLADCADYREFLAFAVSCMSVFNMRQDFAHKQFQHFRMELLTTDPGALGEFCERLTGIHYSIAQLKTLIREGPINRHRSRQASTEPWDIYSSWETWKQDLASMMVPIDVLDGFESQGYDVDMFSARAVGRHDAAKVLVPCLADQLRRMDARHPFLSLLKPRTDATPRLREGDYYGYNLVGFLGKVYALAAALGPVDLETLPPETLREYQERGDSFVGESMEEVKRMLSLRRNRDAPTEAEQIKEEEECFSVPEVIEVYRDFNLVRFKNSLYALRHSLGEVDVSTAEERLIEQYGAQNVIVDTSVNGLKTRIDLTETSSQVAKISADVAQVQEDIQAFQRQHEECVSVPQILESYRDFNLVRFENSTYALRHSLGEVDVSSGEERLIEQYGAQNVIVDTSVNGLKTRIDLTETSSQVAKISADVAQVQENIQAFQRQHEECVSVPQILESYRDFNLVRFENSTYALRQNLGEVDVSSGEERLIEQYGVQNVIVDTSVNGLKTRIDLSETSSQVAKIAADVAQVQENIQAFQRQNEECFSVPQILGIYRDFNLVRFENSTYALRQNLGEVDVSSGEERLIEQYGAQNVIVDTSVNGLKTRIDLTETSSQVEKISADVAQVQENIQALQRQSVEAAAMNSHLSSSIDQIRDTLICLTANLEELRYGPGDWRTACVVDRYRGFRLVREQGKINVVHDDSQQTSPVLEINSPDPELARARIDAYLAAQSIAAIEARLVTRRLRDLTKRISSSFHKEDDA